MSRGGSQGRKAVPRTALWRQGTHRISLHQHPEKGSWAPGRTLGHCVQGWALALDEHSSSWVAGFNETGSMAGFLCVRWCARRCITHRVSTSVSEAEHRSSLLNALPPAGSLPKDSVTPGRPDFPRPQRYGLKWGAQVPGTHYKYTQKSISIPNQSEREQPFFSFSPTSWFPHKTIHAHTGGCCRAFYNSAPAMDASWTDEILKHSQKVCK